MACTITITSVTGTTSGPNTNINISGTVVGCTGNLIVVTIHCGPNTYTQNVNIAAGQINWSTSVLTQCACNGPITVTATCPSAGCTTTFTAANLSCCCPQLTVTTAESPVCVTLPGCPGGGRQITFTINGTLPAGCSSSDIQINYGDSSLSPIHTVTSSPFSFTDTHVYCAGSPYPGVVYATSPIGCPGFPFNVTPSPCPPCASTPLIKLICLLLEFLMLMLFTVAATCYIVPTCGIALVLATVSIVLAVAIYAIYTTNSFLNCSNCACHPFFKWLSIIILATGICLISFIGAGCATFPIGLPFILIFVGIIGIIAWYIAYKTLCPLTICHLWAAIRYAGIVALFALGTLYAALNSVMNPINFIIAVLVALFFITVATLAINSNKNAGNCVNFP